MKIQKSNKQAMGGHCLIYHLRTPFPMHFDIQRCSAGWTRRVLMTTSNILPQVNEAQGNDTPCPTLSHRLSICWLNFPGTLCLSKISTLHLMKSTLTHAAPWSSSALVHEVVGRSWGGAHASLRSAGRVLVRMLELGRGLSTPPDRGRLSADR